ncbi:MAG: hypothetical protein RLY11_912 [Bacteroidota bacterium]|jgi:hypothetical protein
MNLRTKKRNDKLVALHLRLFSRKHVIMFVSGRSSGSTPSLTFPCEQWFAVRGFLMIQKVFTATGIAPEWNRTSLLMIVV